MTRQKVNTVNDTVIAVFFQYEPSLVPLEVGPGELVFPNSAPYFLNPKSCHLSQLVEVQDRESEEITRFEDADGVVWVAPYIEDGELEVFIHEPTYFQRRITEGKTTSTQSTGEEIYEMVSAESYLNWAMRERALLAKSKLIQPGDLGKGLAPILYSETLIKEKVVLYFPETEIVLLHTGRQNAPLQVQFFTNGK